MIVTTAPPPNHGQPVEDEYAGSHHADHLTYRLKKLLQRGTAQVHVGSEPTDTEERGHRGRHQPGDDGVQRLGSEDHAPPHRQAHGEVAAGTVHGGPVLDTDLDAHDGGHGPESRQCARKQQRGDRGKVEQAQEREADGDDRHDPHGSGIAPSLGTDLFPEKCGEHQRYSFRNRASRLVEWV